MTPAPGLAATAALLCTLLPGPAPADPTGERPPPDRPRVGLVLGGGGAMGAAHIGVLKVLEDMNIPVDCVAGTSMGALVGGAYASGMDSRELEQFVTSIDWRAVFSLEQRRQYQPMSVKRANETISNKLEFGLRDGSLIAPRALVETQQIESMIRSMVASQASVRDFDRLPIPFRAVATDLKSGQMVVFDSGDLSVALRASMSVPGAFAPLALGDWLLVDGGITRNLPVDVARESCADVVIAVAVNAQEPAEEEMRSAAGSVARMLDILIDANERASLDSLGPDDVGLRIVLDGVSSTDFHLSAAAIAQGERAARAAGARLASLSVSPGTYQQWRATRAGRSDGAPRQVVELRFDGVDAATATYLRKRVNTRPGRPLDEKQVAEDALKLYATGAYESVAHSLTDAGDGGVVVTFTPVLKSWGPTFLAFDFGLESSLSADTEFVGSALMRRTWPSSPGLEWRALFQLGGETRAETDLRLPFGSARRNFVMPRIAWRSTDEDFYLGDDHVATYQFRRLAGELRAGVEMGTWGELQVGLYWHDNDTVRSIGNIGLPEERGYHDAGYLLEFERDTRETDLWSKSGSRQRLEFMAAEEGLGAEENYQTALLEWNQSALFRSNALVFFDLAGGTAFGSDPALQQTFRLGGPGELTFLQRGQLRSTDFVYGRVGLGWRLTDVRSLLNMDLFAGAAIEGAQAWDTLEGVDDTGFGLGAQLFIGGRTPFGPVQLTGGYGEGGEFAVYLGLGRPVRSRWR